MCRYLPIDVIESIDAFLNQLDCMILCRTNPARMQVADCRMMYIV